jgi:hypothetical protein
MYNDTFTAQLAHQHISDLHREAEGRSLARKARRASKAEGRTKPARKPRNDFSWKTVQSWHVASAY